MSAREHGDDEVDPWAQMRAAIAEARAEIAEVRSASTLTRDEERDLHEAALNGRLGPQLQEIARHVERGETTWARELGGDPRFPELMAGQLDAMAEKYGDRIRAQLESDPDVDGEPGLLS